MHLHPLRRIVGPVSAERTVVDRERPFHLHELFFSATDQRGLIRSANPVFGRVAGYRPEEYLGKPHNLVRHPDMPRSVFRLLWTFLQRGEPIAAYVKNRAKDGGYYWVMALAFPAGDELISIRLKPSSELFPVVEGLYQNLLAIERRVEAQAESVAAGRTAAMEASEAALGAALAELGFEDYAAFMRKAFATEVASRRAGLDGRGGSSPAPTSPISATSSTWSEDGERSLASTLQVCGDTGRHLDALAVRLDRFDRMAAEFAGSTEFFADLAEDVGLFALNAGLTADRFRTKALVLRSVAELMQAGARGVERDVNDLGASLSAATGHVRRLAFAVAGATVAVEMLTTFLTYVASGEAAATTNGGRVGTDTSGLLVSLAGDLADVDVALGGLDAVLSQLLPPLRLLEAHIAQLRILRIRAEVEAAEDASARQFVTIIAEVEGQLAAGLERCRHLAAMVDEARTDAQRLDRKILRQDHARLQEIRTILLRA